MMDRLYKIVPHFLQNLMVTMFNLKSYRVRYGGNYRHYRKLYSERNNWSREQLEEDQAIRFSQLVAFAQQNSPFYTKLYSEISTADQIDHITALPIVSKEMLRKEIDLVYTVPKSEAVVSKTGGTTGKSLEVLFTRDNFQERFALLDNFRSICGYELGKKTAWFSGKSLLTARDIKNNRFWKTDLYHKVRYYSTFHIKEDYLAYYIVDLKKYRPEFLVGFPSNMYEIAKFGIAKGLDFPEGIIKGVFPTAETVTPQSRQAIESFFKTKLFDQYASSEGAPFIFECRNRNLHLELQSGVFEVLDANNEPAKTGRLVTTSFTTYGTPLIRYDIGDSLVLSDRSCDCGNNNPLVDEILGRIDDFIYSPENGKINLGNISNTLKDTKGIVRFQAVQNELNSLIVKTIVDDSVYDISVEKKFIANWRERIGNNMQLEIVYVTEIPVAKSGKYRMVENNIKDLLNE